MQIRKTRIQVSQLQKHFQKWLNAKFVNTMVTNEKFKGLHDKKEKICTALIHVNQMGTTTYLGEHKASSEQMETAYVDRGLSKSIMEISPL